MSDQDTLRGARQRVTAALHAVGIAEADLEAVLLLEAATGLDRLHQMTAAARTLGQDEAVRLESLLQQRLTRKPLSQILGWCEFFGLRFHVSPDVLCPRPETELLVETALTHLASLPQSARVADLGTGSGAIAIALATQRPDLMVIGIDRSAEALAVARRNGEELGVQVDWRSGDWTAALSEAETGRFAAIVSNPPYIPEADWRVLEPEVRDHEPKGALVGGEDGLGPYRLLPTLAWPYLQPDGLLAVEIGQGQDAAVEALFREAGYQRVSSLPDYAGILRVVYGYKPAMPTK